MKIVVYTLGCKVNQYESESIMCMLEKMGHTVYSHLEVADVYIINTCAVTNEAEKKSRQTIAKCKALNKDAKILICGCASEKNAKQFEDIAGVTFVKGVANKLELLNMLNTNGVKIDPNPLEYDDTYVANPTKTRAYIKIQDGCNNFCSYCIIPYLRGRSRSRNIVSVLNEVDKLSKVVKEIILTGIDVSDYKIDGEKALPLLIEKLEPYQNIRFRLSSLEHGIANQKLIDACKKVNMCPHFHLSLQSGCDSVLKRMNRKYLTRDYIKTVKLIRKNFDNPNISTDIIVGFPGETNKEFKKTYNFAKKVNYANIHIFPYSQRSGTVAEKMPQVDGKIKKERVKKLEKLNEKLNKNYIKSNKNRILTVLVEEKDGDYFVGHTENYIKCYIPQTVQIDSFVQVKIVTPYKDGAIAKIINAMWYRFNNVDNDVAIILIKQSIFNFLPKNLLWDFTL